MVLMRVLSIELNWVGKYEKNEEKHNFWAFPRVGTGTKKSIPVPNALF